MPLTWLSDRSVDSVRAALRLLDPTLSSGDVVLGPWIELSEPKSRHGSAMVEQRYFVKFAWSQPAAVEVWQEACILKALGAHATLLRSPRVVVCSDDPAMLVTEWIDGDPLTVDLVGSMDSEQVSQTASELARFLADLHHPEVLAEVQHACGPLATPLPQATTAALRADFLGWIRPDQVSQVARWCDWVDDMLRDPVMEVFVQGDFHGHNHVWDTATQTLTAVLDYGESGPADRAYDFRYLPAQGPGTDLFVATAARYEEHTDEPVDVSRVMAWHIRTVLGDALWRSRASVALPNGGTPAEWVDDLRQRLDQLDLADV